MFLVQYRVFAQLMQMKNLQNRMFKLFQWNAEFLISSPYIGKKIGQGQTCITGRPANDRNKWKDMWNLCHLIWMISQVLWTLTGGEVRLYIFCPSFAYIILYKASFQRQWQHSRTRQDQTDSLSFSTLTVQQVPRTAELNLCVPQGGFERDNDSNMIWVVW